MLMRDSSIRRTDGWRIDRFWNFQESPIAIFRAIGVA